MFTLIDYYFFKFFYDFLQMIYNCYKCYFFANTLFYKYSQYQGDTLLILLLIGILILEPLLFWFMYKRVFKQEISLVKVFTLVLFANLFSGLIVVLIDFSYGIPPAVRMIDVLNNHGIFNIANLPTELSILFLGCVMSFIYETVFILYVPIKYKKVKNKSNFRFLLSVIFFILRFLIILILVFIFDGIRSTFLYESLVSDIWWLLVSTVFLLISIFWFSRKVTSKYIYRSVLLGNIASYSLLLFHIIYIALYAPPQTVIVEEINSRAMKKIIKLEESFYKSNSHFTDLQTLLEYEENEIIKPYQEDRERKRDYGDYEPLFFRDFLEPSKAREKIANKTYTWRVNQFNVKGIDYPDVKDPNYFEKYQKHKYNINTIDDDHLQFTAIAKDDNPKIHGVRSYSSTLLAFTKFPKFRYAICESEQASQIPPSFPKYNQEQWSCGNSKLYRTENPYSGSKYYQDYTYFKCSLEKASYDEKCAGGIKHEAGRTTIFVTLYGNRLRFYFEGGNVTSRRANKLTATKQGDEWFLNIDDIFFVIIPDAIVKGEKNKS